MNIEAVARRTGVPAATLRKWEQRYGVLKPDRTEGLHRRYSERDVLRVEWLKARLEEGYRIGEAAELLGRDPEFGAATDAVELVAEIVAATASPSASRIARALDVTFALQPPAQAITDVVVPALEQVGKLWQHGEVDVAQEHFLSELVRGKLRHLTNGSAGGPRGAVVLCCVPGERHEAGLLSLALLLHADGWQLAYLGADTPLDAAFALAASVGARVLCVSATLPEHAKAAEPELRRLARKSPDVTIVRGGRGFNRETATEAVERLRALSA